MKRILFIFSLAALAVIAVGCGEEVPENNPNGIIDSVFPLFVYDAVEKHPFYGYSNIWLSVDSFQVEKYYKGDKYNLKYNVLKYRIKFTIDSDKNLPVNAGFFSSDSILYNSEVYNLGWKELTKYERHSSAWYSIKDANLCFFIGDTIMFGKFATFKIQNDTLTINEMKFTNL
ncbi:MAG: hypothetical protein LBV75_09350 [Paludibacter sp.]|jgi:hypothetical protein|nr:hypothetical protein [Paludibacter sp.]